MTMMRWLGPIAVLALAGCQLCADDRQVQTRYADTASHGSEIAECVATNRCVPLCTRLFDLDASAQIVRCRITRLALADSTTLAMPVEPSADLSSVVGAHVAVGYVQAGRCSAGGRGDVVVPDGIDGIDGIVWDDVWGDGWIDAGWCADGWCDGDASYEEGYGDWDDWGDGSDYDDYNDGDWGDYDDGWDDGGDGDWDDGGWDDGGWDDGGWDDGGWDDGGWDDGGGWDSGFRSAPEQSRNAAPETMLVSRPQR